MTTKSQAQDKVLAQYQAGLISLKEAQDFQRRIAQISVSTRSTKDKAALYAVYA